MTRAVLSLGANLGDRAGTIRAAITALKDDGLVARSTLYETPPWGPVEQPPTSTRSSSCAARGTPPAGSPGRTSSSRPPGAPASVRWGPRTLDVDVVTVTEDDGTPVLSDDPTLTLPGGAAGSAPGRR